ncbi:uncharacterized protein F5Z01DRAFT_671127 [Emericellopsis atlantica]|uniref:Uncharacterized protein n=1 Tax=Emericellopsis atlantica TaxID=2614577 RepID=A0A9P7ZSZ5_9HYPO|nr:uncharacterized protein F5Z01DRAFT_671127 [Emericellopsis atlantica]KAG9257531.1 hypothetical protein F5Z01DRAFT_671127 [Emericellopsis atlantica]
MATEFKPTLDFLTDAAHLLRTAAPETSAHLMSHRGQLMGQHDLAPSEVQRQHVCNACGNIMLSAHNISLINARGVSKRQRNPTKTPRTKQSTPKDTAKVITCELCSRNTRVPLPTPPKAIRAKSATGKTKPTPASSTVGTPDTAKTSNATSKKRAKSRKAGLQALLAGQQNKGASPLSLASFRQT